MPCLWFIFSWHTGLYFNPPMPDRFSRTLLHHSILLRPKLRLDVQFEHRLDHTAKVMGQNLHNASLICAVLVLLLRLSPNFALIMLNVDSTFDRLWYC